MDHHSGKPDHVWIKSLRSENAALRTKVEELEKFTKHDYISMKNWQEKKAALQATITEQAAIINRVKNLKPFFAKGSIGSDWVSVELLNEALSQESE